MASPSRKLAYGNPISQPDRFRPTCGRAVAPKLVVFPKLRLVPEGGAVMLPWNHTSPPILYVWLPRIQVRLVLYAGRSVLVSVCARALPISCMPPSTAPE